MVWFDLLIVLVSSANYIQNDTPTTLHQTTKEAMQGNQTIYDQRCTQHTTNRNGNGNHIQSITTWLPLCNDADTRQVDENDVQIPNTVASTSAHVQL